MPTSPPVPQSILDAVQPLMDASSNPMYFCAADTTFLASNEVTLRALGLTHADRERIIGNSWAAVLFDPTLNLIQRVPKESYRHLALLQLIKTRYIANNYLPPEWLPPFLERMSIFPGFSEMWAECEARYAEFPFFHRGYMEFLSPVGTIKFDIAAYQFPEPGYFLIEFYAKDSQTQDYLDHINKSDFDFQPTLLTTKRLSEALRSFHSTKLLSKSPLIALQTVKNRGEKNQQPLVQELAKLIGECIEACNPTNSGQQRTSVRLKYEILRLMTYEHATEDQIMWDLGFEPDSDFWAQQNPDKARTPRYPYTGKGDYSATSRASFKRLKAQAIEDVRWRLEELEKAAGN